jgi:hypothetical protein
MASNNTLPYTYLIGWPSQNLWYYGVRYAAGCHPSDLWNPYTTSSSVVKLFVEVYGIPTVIQVRKTFNNQMTARIWEHRVLKRMNVVKDSRWLNEHDQMAPPAYSGDKHWTKVQNYDSANHWKKTDNGREFSKKLWSGDKNPSKNPVFLSRSIEKRSGDLHHMKNPEISKKVSGKNHYLHKDSEALTNRSEKFIKMNKARAGTPYRRVACQYCGMDCGANNIKRHENCCTKNFTKQVDYTDDSVYNKS